MRISRQGHLRAFTLVEVLIAIGLLGMVVAAIYSSWAAILRASKIAQEASAAAQRERISMQLMEDALNGARMFTANGQWYWFAAENGEDASISFVARLPKSFLGSDKFGIFDVRRVSFSLEPGRDLQKQLVLRQAPLLMEFDQDERENPLVLAHYVKGLRFDFWDAKNGEWLDEWNNTNQIPQIVMVSLTLGQANSYATDSRFQRQMVCIVNMPSVAVAAAWQTPGPPAGFRGPGAGPPSNLPGGTGQNQPNQPPQFNPRIGR